VKSDQEIKQQQADQLDLLIDWVGSKSRLASELGVTRQTVYQWVSRGRISATCAAKVDELTNGLFKKQNLRPDVIEWRV